MRHVWIYLKAHMKCNKQFRKFLLNGSSWGLIALWQCLWVHYHVKGKSWSIFVNILCVWQEWVFSVEYKELIYMHIKHVKCISQIQFILLTFWSWFVGFWESCGQFPTPVTHLSISPHFSIISLYQRFLSNLLISTLVYSQVFYCLMEIAPQPAAKQCGVKA